MIASLPSSLSISQPELTYLTTQAHRREIKSEETLIALANVTGQEVTDNTHMCPLYILLVHSCNNAVHVNLRALLRALFFINLNLSHTSMQTHTTNQLALGLYREKWRASVGQLAEWMSSA